MLLTKLNNFENELRVRVCIDRLLTRFDKTQTSLPGRAVRTKRHRVVFVSCEFAIVNSDVKYTDYKPGVRRVHTVQPRVVIVRNDEEINATNSNVPIRGEAFAQNRISRRKQQ